MRESMHVTTATPRWATPSKPLRPKFAANVWLAASRSANAVSSEGFSVTVVSSLSLG